jgi:hypothetical protein
VVWIIWLKISGGSCEYNGFSRSIEKRVVEIPRCALEDNIKMDLKDVG